MGVLVVGPWNKHRHLLNVTRALLFHSNLPKSFWSYALCHAVHIINRLPTPVLQNRTPYELLYATPPTFIDLKVFGCLSYATTLTSHRQKLDPRARKCVFLGFKPGTKGYLLYELQSRNIYLSRHVFYESIFPYSCTVTTNTADSETFPSSQDCTFIFDTPSLFPAVQHQQHSDQSSSPTLPAVQSDSAPASSIPHTDCSSTAAAPILRKSSRSPKMPAYLKRLPL